MMIPLHLLWRFLSICTYKLTNGLLPFQIDEEVGFADKNAGWGTKPTIPIPK